MARSFLFLLAACAVGGSAAIENGVPSPGRIESGAGFDRDVIDIEFGEDVSDFKSCSPSLEGDSIVLGTLAADAGPIVSGNSLHVFFEQDGLAGGAGTFSIKCEKEGAGVLESDPVTVTPVVEEADMSVTCVVDGSNCRGSIAMSGVQNGVDDHLFDVVGYVCV